MTYQIRFDIQVRLDIDVGLSCRPSITRLLNSEAK